jgi:hypothetical protein
VYINFAPLLNLQQLYNPLRALHHLLLLGYHHLSSAVATRIRFVAIKRIVSIFPKVALLTTALTGGNGKIAFQAMATTAGDDAEAATGSSDVPEVLVATGSSDVPEVLVATRRTTARRRKSKLAALTAGKPQDASSFINIDGPEATIAAYCGCNDIGLFRRFWTSPLVLPFYMASLDYRGYQRRNVLSLLGDLPYDQNWASDKDVSQVYPVKAKDEEVTHNRNYGAGLIAWQMLRSLRKGLSTDTPTLDEERFTQLTGCTLPKASKTLIDAEVPLFGPFPGECELEALNRCFRLFAHIKFTTNKSQWEKRFFGNKPWDTPVSISIEYQPDWMRALDSVAVVEAPDEFTGPPPPAEASKSVTVSWKTDSINKKNRSYVAQLTAEDLLSQVPKSVVIDMTPSMLGSEVRDRIRQAFKLHEFEGQLAQLTLHHAENTFPALDADWDVILDVLLKHPDATFSCLMRPLGDGESPWEYDGPPAILRNYLEAKQGDVVSKQILSAEQSEKTQQHIFQMTVPRLDTTFEPLKLFANDRDRLKKAYGGFDVSKPQGRLD